MKMEFKEEIISAVYDECVLTLHGELRYPALSDYKKFKAFLWSLVPKLNKIGVFTINIEKLEYLNSSGQAIINMFVLELKRELTGTGVIVKGTKDYEWQNKFLYTVQQLWGDKADTIEILFDGNLYEQTHKKYYNVKDWK
jgi:hypothetical protein